MIDNHMTRPRKVICENCGKEFYTAEDLEFCSVDCKEQYEQELKEEDL
jgi:hypothetical protein